MRLRKTGWSAAAAILGVVGVAAAQAGDTGPAAPPPSVDVSTPREVDMTPPQRLEQAESFLRFMDQSAATVRRQLEKARQDRDVVKTLCLNDKLNQIDVAIRSARERVDALDTAVQQGDADRARHEHTVARVLRERVQQLLAEANQCIGQEMGFLAETEVKVDISPNIPDITPDELGLDPDIIVEPPVLSSPIQ